MQHFIKKVARKALPAGSPQRMFLGRIKQYILGTNRNRYQKWIKKQEPLLFIDTEEKLANSNFDELISIVLPCYNTPRRYIDALLSSVEAQLYTNWQLCIADGSTDDSSGAYIKELAEKDKRIVYYKLGENRGIVGNTNKAIEIAKGKFIAFMDHDDILSPYALAEVAIALGEHPQAGLIYSDEDKLSDNGKKRSNPFFKPDWSPELLLGINYITHLVVAKKSVVDKIEGLQQGFEGAQDYDFLLRITENLAPAEIVHIPKILYHWRLAQGSTSKNVSEKNYASSAGIHAVRDAMKRRGVEATVTEVEERPTNYRVTFHLPRDVPKVSIIIPFKDKAELLDQCVKSILNKTTYKNYEFILLSNNSTEKATDDVLKKLSKNSHCRIYHWDNPFNYSKINNFGVSKATGEYVVLLNNDTEVISESWLEELIGVASQPGVGAVGPVLFYPVKKHGIQHAGVVVGMGGMAGHVFRHKGLEDPTPFGLAGWPRNYLAVTGACLAISKALYKKMGGLDEAFIVAGNDVAFGIKLYESGYRNIYWPFASLYHYESVSVGTYDNGISGDYNRSLEYYQPYLNYRDPYFNRNLDLMKESISLRNV